MTFISGRQNHYAIIKRYCCGLYFVIYMDMNLFDKIILAATHPVTWQ